MPRLSPFKLGESMVRQLGLDGYLPGFVLRRLARDLDQDWWIGLHVPEEISPCGQGVRVETPLVESVGQPEEPPPADGDELGTSPSGLIPAGHEHPASVQGMCVKLGPLSPPGTIKSKCRMQFAVGSIEMRLQLEWEIAFRALDPIWRSLRCGPHGCVEEEYIATLRATHKITGAIDLELDINSSALGALPSTYTANWSRLGGIGKWDLTLAIDGERVREDDLCFLVNRSQVRPLPPGSVLLGSRSGGSPVDSSGVGNLAVPGTADWIAQSRDCEVKFSLLADGSSKAYQGGRADLDWEGIAIGRDGTRVSQRRIRTVKFNQTNREYRLPALILPRACEPGYRYENRFRVTLYEPAGTRIGCTEWIRDDGDMKCGEPEAIMHTEWLAGDTRLALMFWVESNCK